MSTDGKIKFVDFTAPGVTVSEDGRIATIANPQHDPDKAADLDDVPPWERLRHRQRYGAEVVILDGAPKPVGDA